MRHLLHAVVVLLVLHCVDANALDATKVAAINEAADSFVALAGDSAHTGQAPRLTDPAAKRLLDVVLDTSEIQGGAVLPRSALGDLSTWTLAVVKVGLIYT